MCHDDTSSAWGACSATAASTAAASGASAHGVARRPLVMTWESNGASPAPAWCTTSTSTPRAASSENAAWA
jgi:hypothetical protein